MLLHGAITSRCIHFIFFIIVAESEPGSLAHFVLFDINMSEKIAELRVRMGLVLN